MSKRAQRGCWVMQCPVISTGHVPEDVRDAMLEAPGKDSFYGLYHAPTEHGCFVACPDDLGVQEALPIPLRNCVAWAIRNGFKWLRFDADGDLIPELKTYDW